MVPIINNIIPTQNFELVRDRVGEILLIELTNQKRLNPNITEDINIYAERVNPIGNESELSINLCVASNDFSEKTQIDSKGEFEIYCDIYTSAKQTKKESGDYISAQRLHKFIGLIRYIFQYSGYKTLGFEPGFIGGGGVKAFEIQEANLNTESNFSRMGRVVLTYRVQENQYPDKGIDLAGNNSSVILGETSLGYKYQFNT